MTPAHLRLRRALLLMKRVPVLRSVIVGVGWILRTLPGVVSGGKGERLLEASTHPAAGRVRAALSALTDSPPAAASAIEAFRLETIARTEPLVDGSLERPGPSDAGLRIGEACRVSKPPRHCLLLYLLAREFGARSILELGTNLGISSAYLASAADTRIVTLDASSYRLRLAAALHESLGLGNVRRIAGLFNDTLPRVLESGSAFDFVFIDGHHLYRSTLDYCARIRPFAAPGAVFVFDDIRFSGEMRRAWNEVSTDPAFSFSVDLGDIGLCIVRRDGEHGPVESIPRTDGWLRTPGSPAVTNPY